MALRRCRPCVPGTFRTAVLDRCPPSSPNPHPYPYPYPNPTPIPTLSLTATLSRCTPCEVGAYSSEYGAASCTACPAFASTEAVGASWLGLGVTVRGQGSGVRVRVRVRGRVSPNPDPKPNPIPKPKPKPDPEPDQVRHPHLGLSAAQLARRVLVFHRGTSVLQKTACFFEEKLDMLLDQLFTEPFR